MNRRPQITGLIAALTLVGLVAAIWWGIALARTDSRQGTEAADRKAVVKVSEQVTSKLLGVDFKTKADLDKLAGLTTPELQKELNTTSNLYRQVITKGKIRSKYQNLSAGIVDLNATDAQVILAADMQIYNRNKLKGVRYFRLVLSLEKSQDTWRAAEVKMVP